MKPSIPKAILLSFVLLFVFCLSYFFVFLAFAFLLQIKSIQFLLGFLLNTRFFDVFLIMFSAFLASCAMFFISDVLTKNKETSSLAVRIAGFIIAGIGIISLILNIISGSSFFINIIFIIYGIIFSRKK